MRFAPLPLLVALSFALSPTVLAQDGDDYFVPAAMAELNADAAHVGDLLRAEALDWSATPHVLGGATRRGIDCSGLTQVWFGNLFGISLPRTSSEQFETGVRVDRDALQPGDLVFFGSARRISHVGVYVGDGEFAHVSSSSGVTTSRLGESYWKRRYQGARRVLAEMDVPERVTFASASTPPARRPSATRAVAGPSSEAPTFTGASARGSRPAATRRVGW